VFEPSFVKAAPGDVIHFQPTDPSHNAETISTMLPAGATPMKGAMNKEAVLTVSKPGLYGIKCMPHYSMGMVALVQVGKPTAADVTAAKAVKLPPFAAKRMNAALAQVK
jgi:pseudoazurin